MCPRTLWHQDEAVITEDARQTNILTVWVAISDATTHNGCMFAVVGSHHDNARPTVADYGLETHCPGKILPAEIYIPDESVDKARLVALEARAVMWFCYTDAPSTVPEKTNQTVSDGALICAITCQPCQRTRLLPLFTLSGETDAIVKNAENYRQSWHAARDNIVSGKIPAVFNNRWEKYREAPLCAERKNHVATNGFFYSNEKRHTRRL